MSSACLVSSCIPLKQRIDPKKVKKKHHTEEKERRKVKILVRCFSSEVTHQKEERTRKETTSYVEVPRQSGNTKKLGKGKLIIRIVRKKQITLM